MSAKALKSDCFGLRVARRVHNEVDCFRDLSQEMHVAAIVEDEILAVLLAERERACECLMADCHNPQEHFCYKHCVEVFGSDSDSTQPSANVLSPSFSEAKAGKRP